VQKSDVQHRSRGTSGGGDQARRRHSKFFVQVPAAPPSFNNNNEKKGKRERGGGDEKEVKIRPRKGRAQKRQKMSGPEAPGPDVADVDADGRASPVTVVERFLPDYVVENLDGTLRPFWKSRVLSFFFSFI
jgi:hypothetical protein